MAELMKDGEGFFDPFPEGSPAQRADSIPGAMFFRFYGKCCYVFLLPVKEGRLINVVGTGNSPDEAAVQALEKRAEFAKFLEQ